MKKRTRILLTSWFILSGSAGSPTPCVADALVSLKQDVEITRPVVRLSDVFEGVPTDIDRDIAKAPSACKPAVYDEPVLARLAQTYRLDWKASAGDKVSISTPCSRLTGEMLRETIIARLKAESGARKQTFDVTFDKRSMEIIYPTNTMPAYALQNFFYDPTAKQFRADVTAEVDRKTIVVPVSGRVSVRRSVPVLAHRLEAGTAVGERDLDWVEMPEERITAEIVTEPSQLIGREMKRDMPEGEVLRSRDIVPPRFVQRGSLVTLKIETPFMLLTTQGKAEQDGVDGEVIRVKNTQSNRVVEGVVTAPGVVEIRTTQKIASAE